MLDDIDVKKLSKLSGPDRAFLSIYMSGNEPKDWLDNQWNKCRLLLRDAEDELEYLNKNVELAKRSLREHRRDNKGLCIYSCWAIDFIELHSIPVKIESRFIVDSSPYIRPIAELQDEHENYAVVVADNKRARVYIVTSAVTHSETSVRGNIKNQVKVGGWSQQRYQRRRDKQLMLYAREIGDHLLELDKVNGFRRVILVGAKETLKEISQHLPSQIKQKVVDEKSVHLAKGEDWVDKEIADLFTAQERDSEVQLWSRIESEYLRDGLAVVGHEAVQRAAAEGRVEAMIVLRKSKVDGIRCADCENLSRPISETCPACGSDSVFTIDYINELVELVSASNGEVEFADPIPGLNNVGGVAALLRY